jgi:prolyl-tRNA synthetase
MIKTLIYRVDGGYTAVMVRGDRELNEGKMKKFLGAKEAVMASPEEIERLTGGPLGFSGPVGLSGLRLVADYEIGRMEDAITGANEEDMHLTGVEPLADFSPHDFADLRKAIPGDECPRCGGSLGMRRGIELGHIFKLGTKYSDSMRAAFLDEKGEQVRFIMGCYGIGITRIVAVAIEQRNDRDGIIWPASIAPYHVAVLPVLSNDAGQREMAEEIYAELRTAGIETVIDDRDLRPGVKFKDLDLAGFPLRLTIGEKAVKTGKVEFKKRRTGETLEVERAQAREKVKEILDSEMARLA